MRPARVLLSIALLTSLAIPLSCGLSSVTAPDLMEADSVASAFKGEGDPSCAAIRPQTEPDLMGWDSGSRLNLKALQEQGVVGVRYKAVGCNVELEVLQCVGKGVEYGFSPYSATESKTAKSQRDLFAELPIGAAKLGGKVGGGRALRTDYMLAGVLKTPVMKAFPSEKLEGDCDRATHVVSTVYLGGFAMASGQSEQLAAEASIFGIGVGGSQDRTAERLASEGNPESCTKAQKEGTREPLCNVPLRIGLTPIAWREEAVPITPVVTANGASTLTSEQVSGVVSADTARVRRKCWDPVSTGSSSDAPWSVKVSVEISISPGGSVTSAKASGGNEEYYPGLTSCVQGVVSAWEFPSAAEPSTVRLPFSFHKKGLQATPEG